MANTYTTNYNLAKPAHGDVNWHIPINENWDKIDTELDKAFKMSGPCLYVQAFPSPVLQASSDTHKSIKAGVMTKIKEIRLSPNLRGESGFTVKFMCGNTSTAFGYTGIYQIYVNDAPRGNPHEVSISRYAGGEQITEEIFGLHANDRLQVYARTTHGDVNNAPISVWDFRLYGTYTACPDPVPPTHTVVL